MVRLSCPLSSLLDMALYWCVLSLVQFGIALNGSLTGRSANAS